MSEGSFPGAGLAREASSNMFCGDSRPQMPKITVTGLSHDQCSEELLGGPATAV